MEKLVLIRPGGISDWVPLQAVLREAHEALQKERADEIASRSKKGIPLDDDVDWKKVSAAVEAKNAGEVVRLTAGKFLEPLDDYAAVPGNDDVKLKFRAISEAARRTLMIEVAAAGVAVAKALDTDDAVKIDEAQRRRDAAFAAFIGAAVVAVDVAGDVNEVVDDALVEALAASGLLVSVFAAARDYQRLSPGKGKRFGSPQPST